jgi:DNA polymerase-3 subunit delta'
MTVWDEVVGQDRAVAVLRDAATRPEAMTHAWLITGPPGSGRSVAARAFAAALQCPEGGCGTCRQCTSVMHHSHPDVLDAATQKVVIGIDDVREWITLASRSPAMGRWRVLLMEDADRMLERTSNVLLKGLEEPPRQTVWILTAPSPADVSVTIRSRCRGVHLGIPTLDAVVGLLVDRDGVPPEQARLAALAAECHIGLARHLATSHEAAERRAAVLAIPAAASSVALAVIAAGQLDRAAKEEAESGRAKGDEASRAALLAGLGEAAGARMTATARAALKQFDEEAKRRARRRQIDTLDRALVYLLSFFRDVLALQLGAKVELVNSDHADLVTACAGTSALGGTMASLAAVELARTRVAANASPGLALEAMAVTLAMARKETTGGTPNG